MGIKGRGSAHGALSGGIAEEETTGGVPDVVEIDDSLASGVEHPK